MNSRLILTSALSLIFGGSILAAQTGSCIVSGLVLVLDEKTNLPIDGLTDKDFKAKFHGQELLVRGLTRPSAQRRFVVVLDRSASMTTLHSEDFGGRHDPNRFTSATLEDLLPAIPKADTVAFLAFAGEFSTKTEFALPGDSVNKVQELLKWSPTGKGNKRRTPLWDNIDLALGMLGSPTQGDVIVVVSDGVDNMSKLSAGSLRERLVDAGVTVLAVTLSDPNGATPETREGPRELLDLVKATGGTALALEAQGWPWVREVSIPVHPGELIRLLAHQYKIEFDIPALPKTEKWQLEVSSLNQEEKPRLFYRRSLPACASTR